MRWEQIEIKWFEFRPKAKRHWVQLSEAQLDAIKGRRDLLADSLQQSYGLAPDAADEQIQEWCTTFGNEEVRAIPK